jgi:hypothetical protein
LLTIFDANQNLNMEEIDIWRSANQMLVEHGMQARSEALKLAAKMLERRDYEDTGYGD